MKLIVPGDVTQLLSLWAQGDRGAFDALMPLVYEELHKLADIYLKRERSGHMLQPTALVNEAWMKLVRQDEASYQNRHRFYAMAAQIMRQILVDHARRVRAAKRDGISTPLDNMANPSDDRNERMDEFLALDEALAALAAVSSRQAKVIEMRYFGGLNGDEIADLLGVSSATISRDQRSAEAWLNHVLAGGIRYEL